MTKISTLHDQWLKTPGYEEAYAQSQAEFELARQLIEARTKSGLSQEEIASRMGTSQSAIARLESGNSLPSMRTLSRYAKATNCEVSIRLQPIKRTAARSSKTGENLTTTGA
ncbi:MAG: helix-turn-helix transcriptional regulator [Rhodoferax sp.]|nr:helix-turn-helix transcriptional regulator [Rhodoferax sp.]